MPTRPRATLDIRKIMNHRGTENKDRTYFSSVSQCLCVEYDDGRLNTVMDVEITPTEVQSQMASGNAPILLDVREPAELQMASIAGVVHIPMGEIPARARELDPEKHIVVLCHHGVRSLNVTYWLRQQGFDKAQSMRGGIDRWSREVDTKVPTY